MVSPLESAVEFLRDFGFFSVVLPFLLVFTIVFAVLEKTKIFGTETVEGEKVPKKNINAMVAFSIAFFVVATKEIVEAIQVSLPQVTLVLIVLISFMLLAGSFMSDKEFSFETRKGWKVFLTLVVFIGVILIFLNAFKLESGETWLEKIFTYIGGSWQGGSIISSIIFLAIIALVIWVVVGFKPSKGKKEEEK